MPIPPLICCIWQIYSWGTILPRIKQPQALSIFGLEGISMRLGSLNFDIGDGMS
jgi:hypothetical protein